MRYITKKEHREFDELIKNTRRGFIPIDLEQNPFKNDHLYKIYNDGGHYVATLVHTPLKSKKRLRPKKTQIDKDLDQYFLECKREEMREKEILFYMREKLLECYPNLLNADELVAKAYKRNRLKYHARLKRLKRKSNLNVWNNFVTITYDPEKHDEESFRKKLSKTLSNLHTRRGWCYMGVFERAPETNRLHFHAVMYIPKNEMVGEMRMQKDYSTAQHCQQITRINSFFEERFGRNDFEEINENDIKSGRVVNYLVKYITKSDEKIIYSRGIPTFIYKTLSKSDIASAYYDFVSKYVLFDYVIAEKREPKINYTYNQLNFLRLVS